VLTDQNRFFLFIIGTRPEAIKLAPVILEFKNRGYQIRILITGQHATLAKDVLTFFQLTWDYEMENLLDQYSNYLVKWSAKCLENLDNILGENIQRIKGVIVQGDTTSAYIGAYYSFLNQIPVFHVEGGLRTNQIYSPFPEELNRKMIAQIATLHFSPTTAASQNLIREGVDERQIILTGNTIVDAIRIGLSKIKVEHLEFDRTKKSVVLVTCHRRENFGDPILNVFKAVKRLASEWSDFSFVVVKHTNPATVLAVKQVFGESLGKNISIVDPLNYGEMLTVLSEANFVITDSGGIQEEVPSFQIPALVTRDTTERPEGVLSGHLFLVEAKEENIYQQALWLRDHELGISNNPYGTGFSSAQILKAVNEYFD
jgi:UDP-N-acetylglucosamine 2-epimerase (non-hydrolysing)